MPASTAAALPPLEPPGLRSRSQGLRVTPDSGESVKGFQPNSGVVVLPNNTAPCARNFAVTGKSSFQVWFGSIVREPTSRGHPRVEKGILDRDRNTIEQALRLALVPPRL